MRIIRTLLAIVLPITAVLAAPAAPKYLPLKFSEMVMSADLIVHGEIVVLTKETFTLEIETLVAGELTAKQTESKRIEVRRFHDWTCASRWLAYSPGQEVVLFLAKPTKDSPFFRILSAGGEGEMPVSTTTDAAGKTVKTVRVRGRGTESLEQVEQFYIGHLASRNQPKWISQATLRDLVHAIRELGKCFRIEVKNGQTHQRTFKVQKTGKQLQIDKLKAHSKIGALLVKEAGSHLVS